MNLAQQIAFNIEAVAPALEQIPGAAIIHHIHEHNVVYMSRRGADGLNTSLNQLKEMGTDYHKHFFNEEDAKEYVPRLAAMLERNNDEELVSFFQQVRSWGSDEWRWHLSSIRIFMRDDEDKPLLTLTISIPIDPAHHITQKVERLLEENNFLRSNKDLFAALTKRERQILSFMAKDTTSIDISKELYLSEDTVKTHRRNIKKKIRAENHYDVVKFAQAFDLL